MKTLLRKKSARFLVVASLAFCPILSSVATKMPAQAVVKTTQPIEPVKKNENPTLARNATKKPEPEATESTTKVQDKKAIGRCWQRLMNMAREIKHAHPNKNKN